MPENIEVIPITMHGRGWDILIQSAIGNSLLRVSGELITNSVDSYDRLVKDKKMKKTDEKTIIINYFPGSDYGFYFITDNAEGMTSIEIKDYTSEYGAPTAREASRGIFGFGLKDACLAMHRAKIFSIKNNKISEAEISRDAHGNPQLTFLRKDIPVSNDERKKLGILKNGTRIELLVPSHFNMPNFDKFSEHLENFSMLRKINLMKDLKIFLINSLDINSSERQRIFYEFPKGEEVVKKSFEFTYRNHPIRANLKILKSNEELSQRGEEREGGLLIFYNGYAVVECTLFGYDTHPLAGKFFGEIELEGFKEVLDEEPTIMDPHRKTGLDRNHIFYQKLESFVVPILKKIIEEEEHKQRISAETFEPKSLNEALRALNKIVKTELETEEIGPPPQLPVEYITFYYRNTNLVEVKEDEEKGLFLLINSENVPNKTKIKISCTNKDILVAPKYIFVNHSKSKDGRIHEKVFIRGLCAGASGEVRAQYEDKLASINVIVNENPRLHPKNGFEFIPDEMKLTVNEIEKASLIINKLLIESGKRIVQLESSNKNIEYDSEITLPKRLEKHLISRRFGGVLEIPIKLLGKKLKEKGTLTAKYGKCITKLQFEVVTPIEKQTKGLFKDIKIEELPEIQDITIDRDGNLIANSAHPLLKSFRQIKNYKKRDDYRTIISKALAQQVCTSIVDRKFQEGKLIILSPENPESVLDTIKTEIKKLYFKHSIILYKIVWKLLRENWI